MSKGDVAKLLKFRGIIREKLEIQLKEKSVVNEPIEPEKINEEFTEEDFYMK